MPGGPRHVLAPVDLDAAAPVGAGRDPPRRVERHARQRPHRREVPARRLGGRPPVPAGRRRARPRAPLGERRARLGHRGDRRDGDEQVAAQEADGVLDRPPLFARVGVAAPRLEAAAAPNRENGRDSVTSPRTGRPASVASSGTTTPGARPQRGKTSARPAHGHSARWGLRAAHRPSSGWGSVATRGLGSRASPATTAPKLPKSARQAPTGHSSSRQPSPAPAERASRHPRPRHPVGVRRPHVIHGVRGQGHLLHPSRARSPKSPPGQALRRGPRAWSPGSRPHDQAAQFPVLTLLSFT